MCFLDYPFFLCVNIISKIFKEGLISYLDENCHLKVNNTNKKKRTIYFLMKPGKNYLVFKIFSLLHIFSEFQTPSAL